MLAGVTLGVLGRLSDYAFEPVRVAFVLGAPWIVVAVGVGAVAHEPRRGLELGALALLISVVVYYAVMTVVEHHVSRRYGLAMAVGWGALAVAVGAIFGALGAALRAGPPPTRALAAVLVGAVLSGEALLFLLRGADSQFAVALGAQLGLGAATVAIAARRESSAPLLALAVVVAASAFVLDLGARIALRRYGWGGA